MDSPREAERDGVAPRHRPPLAAAPPPQPPPPTSSTGAPPPAAPGAAGDAVAVAALGGGAGAGAQQQQQRATRRRAGSTVKARRGGGGAGSPTPPPGAATARATPTSAAAAARRSSSPQVSMHATPTPAPGKGEAHNTRYASHRRPPNGSSSSSSAQSPPHGVSPLATYDTQPPPPQAPAADAPTVRQWPVPANAPPNYRPASARPPLSRVPTFPLVDAYVPETSSSGRRHPRQLIPDDIGFPTPAMDGKIHSDDLDDRLLMATCAVLHGFQNRALCPKEVAEVMLERGWLKNAGTTPFAHVSTCIRTHVQRATTSSPPYTQLLTPFELLGALTPDEVRAVGLHPEQRPAVKRGTLWYLNPQVFGPGIGCDDPFVRCRREAGLSPSEKGGVYVRGLAPLQHAAPPMPPALGLSSTLFSNVLAEEGEGGTDEAGMGRGRRKRRASSAMMAAMGGTNSPAAPSPLGSGTTTPLAIPAPRPTSATPVTSFTPIAPASALPILAPAAAATATATATASTPTSASAGQHRRTQSMSGSSSAPTKSSIPRLKLRLTALDEGEGVDSDGHTGEAAEHRRKSKKKVRRAGSEGVSRAGSVESSVVTTDDDDFLGSSRSTAFSSISASALLAQSLLAASTSGALPPSALSLAPVDAVSPDSLSLAANNGTSFPFLHHHHHHHRGRASAPLLSVSAPNIFSHHFANAPSPPDVIMDDVSSPSASGGDSRPTTSAGGILSSSALVGAGLSPPADSPSADEDDFHEAMLRGDDFEFEWGSESYTTAGTSSLETSVAVAAADLARAFSQQAKQHDHDKAASPSAAAAAAAADTDKDKDDAATGGLDTPATTPRSPGKELDGAAGEEEDAMGEAGQTAQAQGGSSRRGSDDAIELVHGPLGTISRVGMSTTLCGEMAPASDEDGEDGDVVIVAAPASRAPASDPGTSADALINLAHHDEPTVAEPLALPALPHAAAPPPSPLPLDLSPVLALTNAYAGTDFNFVGHDEADSRSPFFRSASTFADHDDLADDEDEEDDDIVTVKVEEDDDDEVVMAVSSEPSSRSSSAVPTFDARLLANVRAASAASSSSDSDGFDPMTFVSAPMLATGLPVPQPAPSPPETSDWSLGLDMMDDVDVEHGAVDFTAPETIGLEELDLAWAGDDDDSVSPAPAPAPAVKQAARPLNLTIPRSSSGAFLTGSTYEHSHRFTSPMPSPRRTSSSRVPLVSDLAKKPRAPATPALSRTSSGATIFASPAKAFSSSSPPAVIMEPVVPLEPPTVATIVQRGVVVFSTSATDLTTARTTSLLRRVDTDYVNATVLLQAAVSSPLERASTLASLLVKADTVRVPHASEPGVEGTWVPLEVARAVVDMFSTQLGHLGPFLADDLGARFPEPIPTMRSGLKAALEQRHAGDDDLSAPVLGSPGFEGAELVRRCGPPSSMPRSHSHALSTAASRGSPSASATPLSKRSAAPTSVVIPAPDSDDDLAEDGPDEDVEPAATTPVSTRAATRRGNTAAAAAAARPSTRRASIAGTKQPQPQPASSAAAELQQSPPRRSSRRQSTVAK
ncbi:hypothetical protein JCM9279_003179 [Rhodotorula babjevae]